MKIATSKGTVFDVSGVYAPIASPGSVMIDYEDARSMAQIAADWDGVDSFETSEERLPGVKKTYSGFIRLESVTRHGRLVRVVLRRP